MDEKQKHLKYLQSKGKYSFDCPKGFYSEEEQYALRKFGYWFEALTDGTLQAFTLEQENFILVAKGQRKPETLHEKAWFRCLGRMELKKQNPAAFNTDYSYIDDSFFSREDYYKTNPARKPKI